MSAAPEASAFQAGLTASGVYYELHGRGAPLLLGFPVLASYADVFGAEAAASVKERFLSALADRYCVLLLDYPSIGRSRTIPPEKLTLGRTCADLLDVADAAGFERFAYWGGAFGAVAGLMLAARTTRVAALVCAGWPPLGAPYADIARAVRTQIDDPPPHARIMLRTPSQYAQWSTFFTSVPTDWDEAVVAQIRCPRLFVYGADAATSVGNVELPIAHTARARRNELQAMGWQVRELPAHGAGLILEPDALAPPVRRFLDAVSIDSNFNEGERS